MKISFIVLTYNRAEALLAVLRSLAVQCGTDHEVLIADDGSSQAEVAELHERCPPFQCAIRHVWHADTGFTASRARNLGAYHAKGDYLVFLDGDCVPSSSFVKAHTLLAETGCFVNGSRVLLSERLTGKVTRQKFDLLQQLPLFWWRARLTGDTNKLLHMLFWPWSVFRVKRGFRWSGIRSCNFAVWRSDFVAINGFDETFEGWGHEDADLVLRLNHLGIRRKNGFWATEVYHLWHRENSRDRELGNKQKVMERMTTDLVLAEKGLSDINAQSSGNVTALN